MSKLADDLEREFRSRTDVPGPILFLDPATALELIRQANESNVRILGVDGFVIQNGKVQPFMKYSVDYANCKVGVAKAAIDFVVVNWSHVTHFEVVLDSSC